MESVSNLFVTWYILTIEEVYLLKLCKFCINLQCGGRNITMLKLVKNRREGDMYNLRRLPIPTLKEIRYKNNFGRTHINARIVKTLNVISQQRPNFMDPVTLEIDLYNLNLCEMIKAVEISGIWNSF